MSVNFQTGEKQRSSGKGASVIAISFQLQEFSHALFRKARGKGGVALRSQHATLRANALVKPGLPWVWVTFHFPFPLPMLFPHPCNIFISPTAFPPHMPPPCLTPLTGTTSCLGNSPQPSSKHTCWPGTTEGKMLGQSCWFPPWRTQLWGSSLCLPIFM